MEYTRYSIYAIARKNRINALELLTVQQKKQLTIKKLKLQ